MIALTFVSSNVRADREEFDTDDLGEALAEFGRKHFGTGPEPDGWVFALVVERGDTVLTRAEIADRVEDIAQIELSRSLGRTD